MLMKLAEWLSKAKGSMGKTFYARACKWDSTQVIVQRKPAQWERKDYKTKEMPLGAQMISELAPRASLLYKGHRAALEAEVVNIRKGKSRNKAVRGVATAWSLAMMIASGKYPDITAI